MTDIIGLIKKHLNMRFRELQTVEVVIVEAVDLTTWTCSVRPKPRINVRGNIQDMPIIMGVPIAVQKAGNSVILMPIKAGDVGAVIFSKHALDTLLINRDTVEIVIPRSFDINDAIYTGGLFIGTEDVPSVVDGEILIQNQSGSYIKFSDDGNIEIKAKRIDLTES